LFDGHRAEVANACPRVAAVGHEAMIAACSIDTTSVTCPK
jgi:hypothetical protein